MKKIKKKTRKDYVNEAIANGDIERLNKIHSAMILLFAVAEGLKGDAEEIEARSKIAVMDMKMCANKLSRAFDDYRASYRKMVGKESGKDLIEDFEKFDKEFRRYAKIEDI
ncbi:MAG: hypothetical protein RR346_04925 [Bacteroidales bacterium]